MSAKSPARNPDGLVKAKPIALRLMPEELDDAKRVATKYRITRSALARKAYLAGLPLVEKQMEAA